MIKIPHSYLWQVRIKLCIYKELKSAIHQYHLIRTKYNDGWRILTQVMMFIYRVCGSVTGNSMCILRNEKEEIIPY